MYHSHARVRIMLTQWMHASITCHIHASFIEIGGYNVFMYTDCHLLPHVFWKHCIIFFCVQRYTNFLPSSLFCCMHGTLQYSVQSNYIEDLIRASREGFTPPSYLIHPNCALELGSLEGDFKFQNTFVGIRKKECMFKKKDYYKHLGKYSYFAHSLCEIDLYDTITYYLTFVFYSLHSLYRWVVLKNGIQFMTSSLHRFEYLFIRAYLHRHMNGPHWFQVKFITPNAPSLLMLAYSKISINRSLFYDTDCLSTHYWRTQ